MRNTDTLSQQPAWARQTGKALVPLLGVLAVLAMAVAAVAIVLQMQEHDKRLAKEQELRLAVAENDDLKARLQDAQQAKSRIDEELGRLRQEFSDTQGKLARAVEAQETLNRSIEDREKEIGRLSKDLEQTRTQNKEIAAQLSELQTERETMRQQLADLEKAKGELAVKVTALSGQPTVELDKVLVGGAEAPTGDAGGSREVPTGSSASSAPNGQVMVVNREYDFIVVNLGKNHGLSVGQEFQIVRGNEVLGTVKVEKVYDELSAAAILPDSRKDSIREGDTVKAL